MRQIDAWSRCDLQAMSTDAPSAHATAALIGDTCDTTTTRLSRARSARSAHAARTRRSSSASDSPPSGTKAGSSRHRPHTSDGVSACGTPSYTPYESSTHRSSTA